MPEFWTINSEHTEAAFIAHIKALRAEHGYITYSAPRIGADRSLDQNALFHVWATEYAGHLLKKHTTEITTGELEGMKRAIKLKYNAQRPNNFIVCEIVNPFDGTTKKDVSSSKTWRRGEMFDVLSWLQMMAANDGLALESRGEYQKLQRGQNE